MIYRKCSTKVDGSDSDGRKTEEFILAGLLSRGEKIAQWQEIHRNTVFPQSQSHGEDSGMHTTVWNYYMAR